MVAELWRLVASQRTNGPRERRARRRASGTTASGGAGGRDVAPGIGIGPEKRGPLVSPQPALVIFGR